jgi:ribosome-interacting GTPase 1
MGIRLNKKRPDISLKEKKSGGVTVNSTVGPLTHIDEKMVRTILHEYKIHNADVLFRCDATVDEFIDVVEGNRCYIPCLYVRIFLIIFSSSHQYKIQNILSTSLYRLIFLLPEK